MFLFSGAIRAAIATALMISAPGWAAEGMVFEAAGEVTVAVGKNSVQPVVQNQVIGSNTFVSTGENSHAVLKFEDGQVVAMQSNTTFNVREYKYVPNKIEASNIIFSKLKGGLLFITGLIGQRNKKAFQLATPNATIGVRGTEFMVVMVGGELYGKVLTGSISVKNKAGSSVFDAGQNVLVSSPGDLPKVISSESLPKGIFNQLESMQMQVASIVEAPFANDVNIAVPSVDGVEVIAGGALLGVAAAVAGGSPVIMPTAATVSGMAGVVAGMSYPPDSVLSGGVVLPFSSQGEGKTEFVGKSASPDLQAEVVAIGDKGLLGKHNFTPARSGTGEICVFCHTPQGIESEVAAPLWNRTNTQLSEYKAYSSIGSATAAASGSVSMACLSCHDGTQAYDVVPNTPSSYLDMGIYPDLPDQVEINSKKFLKQHHPIGMLYGGGGLTEKQPDAPVDALAAFDSSSYDALAVRKLTRGNVGPNPKAYPVVYKDLPAPESRAGLYNKQDFNVAEHSGSGSGTVWWLESKNSNSGQGRQKVDFYLYTRTDTVDGMTMNRPYVECSSCHDPHSTNPTFLRIKNYGSNVCLTCHAK